MRWLMLWVIRSFFLTAGQASDLEGADELLPQVEADALLGDKSFDADKRVREVLRLRGIRCVIPFRKNRLNPCEYDKELYKERHLIENFFCKLKQYRGIATRYDKCSAHFLSGIYLASSLILLA